LKLSVRYPGSAEFDFISFLKIVKQSAVESIELTAYNNDYLSLDSTPEEVSMFRSLINGYGIKLTSIITEITLIEDDEQKRDENINRLKQYFELAKQIGCKAVSVKLGSYPADANKHKVDRKVVDMLNQAEQLCRSTDIDLLVNANQKTSKGETLYPIFRDVASERIGIVWNIDETCRNGESYEKTIRLIGDRIKVVHITDRASFGSEFDYCKIGKGILNVEDIVNYLMKAKYDGVFSLKWRKSPDNAIAFDEQLLSFIEFMRDIENNNAVEDNQ